VWSGGASPRDAGDATLRRALFPAGDVEDLGSASAAKIDRGEELEERVRRRTAAETRAEV
jgi:hypothetical protein